MMARRLLQAVLSVAMLAVVVLGTACESQPAREQALTGDIQHERHDTGMDSQVGDY